MKTFFKDTTGIATAFGISIALIAATMWLLILITNH
jgi:hypothetical protein